MSLIIKKLFKSLQIEILYFYNLILRINKNKGHSEYSINMFFEIIGDSIFLYVRMLHLNCFISWRGLPKKINHKCQTGVIQM